MAAAIGNDRVLAAGADATFRGARAEGLTGWFVRFVRDTFGRISYQTAVQPAAAIADLDHYSSAGNAGRSDVDYRQTRQRVDGAKVPQAIWFVRQEPERRHCAGSVRRGTQRWGPDPRAEPSASFVAGSAGGCRDRAARNHR
jgi:hypothetical protein